jgi:hypothetical protein
MVPGWRGLIESYWTLKTTLRHASEGWHLGRFARTHQALRLAALDPSLRWGDVGRLFSVTVKICAPTYKAMI